MKKLIRLVAFYFGILLIFQSFARADAMEDWLESGPARGVPVCAASFVFLGNLYAKTEVEKSNFNKIVNSKKTCFLPKQVCLSFLSKSQYCLQFG